MLAQYIEEQASSIISGKESGILHLSVDGRKEVAETVLRRLRPTQKNEATLCWMRQIQQEAEDVIRGAAFINSHETEIESICKRLDARTRAIIQVAVRLSLLDSYSAGAGKWVQRLMFDWHDEETLQDALDSYTDDEDMQLLAGINRAAERIEEIEDSKAFI